MQTPQRRIRFTRFLFADVFAVRFVVKGFPVMVLERIHSSIRAVLLLRYPELSNSFLPPPENVLRLCHTESCYPHFFPSVLGLLCVSEVRGAHSNHGKYSPGMKMCIKRIYWSLIPKLLLPLTHGQCWAVEGLCGGVEAAGDGGPDRVRQVH